MIRVFLALVFGGIWLVVANAAAASGSALALLGFLLFTVFTALALSGIRNIK